MSNELALEITLELTRMAAESQNSDWLKATPEQRVDRLTKLFHQILGAMGEFTSEESSHEESRKACQLEDLNPDDLGG